ncbi:MAG: hypothetical protein CR974_03905 [Gammaproteobacteria bacterium]|nr:MAG: hypothetical protein CR974_03905 [Gammaproteobacteria bacterium]
MTLPISSTADYQVYSSEDPDAPQAPDYKSIFKACLITGYGQGADEKAPAGWELVFDEADKLVIRPNDPRGDNDLLRIEHDGIYRKISSFESMTDVDNGVAASNNHYIVGGNGSWFIVATLAWCLLIINVNNTDGVANVVFFGNLPSGLPEELNKTILLNTSYSHNSAAFPQPLYSHGAQNYHRNQKIRPYPPYRVANGYYNIATTGNLKWCDLIVSSATELIGVLPILKCTPVNAGFETWHEIAPNAYALKVSSHNTRGQLVMDFNDVN